MSVVLKEKLAEDPRIVKITINRPEVLNALSGEVMAELTAAVDELSADDSVKAIILTGAGEKAFVAGADISEFKDINTSAMYMSTMETHAMLSKLETMGKIVIAAVGGYALGGGCELAMCCDMRIATPNAKFGLPEVSLGALPGYGGTQRLQRLIGMARAKEMIYTGKPINAEKALEYGLVNKVVESHAELIPTCVAIIQAMLKNSFNSIIAAKQCLYYGAQVDLRTALSYEAATAVRVFASDDLKEGSSAFMEKRKANFKSSNI